MKWGGVMVLVVVVGGVSLAIGLVVGWWIWREKAPVGMSADPVSRVGVIQLCVRPWAGAYRVSLITPLGDFVHLDSVTYTTLLEATVAVATVLERFLAAASREAAWTQAYQVARAAQAKRGGA